ncbi:MAG: hypothetical protein H7835_04060, partial [Magnetococcus sp. XQGC-1]
MGELQLQSKPDRPFQAVATITVEPGEEILSVDMGSAPDYQLLNLPRKAVVEGIAAQLKQEDGRLQVLLQAAAPLREKDFHIVLRVASNHHTYFPFFRVQGSAAGKGVGNATAKLAGNAGASADGGVQNQDARPNPGKNEKMYGPVRKKEGLGDVARRFHKGSALTITQVEVAIWQRNPGRFIRNNMNGLKSGTKLVIPSQEEMARIDKQEASDLQASHEAEWKKPPRERRQMASLAPLSAVAPSRATQEKGEPSPPEGTPLSKEPAKEPIKEPTKEAAKEPSKEAAKEPTKEPSKEAAKEPSKEAAKEPSKEAAK